MKITQTKTSINLYSHAAAFPLLVVISVFYPLYDTLSSPIKTILGSLLAGQLAGILLFFLGLLTWYFWNLLGIFVTFRMLFSDYSITLKRLGIYALGSSTVILIGSYLFIFLFQFLFQTLEFSLQDLGRVQLLFPLVYSFPLIFFYNIFVGRFIYHNGNIKFWLFSLILGIILNPGMLTLILFIIYGSDIFRS